MTNEEINSICLTVYRARLNADHRDSADRQVRDDNDNGEKQASRALFYRPVVIETLIAVGLHERPVKTWSSRAKEEELAAIEEAGK